jgi:hypothetical protein
LWAEITTRLAGLQACLAQDSILFSKDTDRLMLLGCMTPALAVKRTENEFSFIGMSAI